MEKPVLVFSDPVKPGLLFKPGLAQQSGLDRGSFLTRSFLIR